MLSFFPRGVLDEVLNLIESVSEGFPSYSFINPSRYIRASLWTIPLLVEEIFFAKKTLESWLLILKMGSRSPIVVKSLDCLNGIGMQVRWESS